jgi:hypothetical protein
MRSKLPVPRGSVLPWFIAVAACLLAGWAWVRDARRSTTDHPRDAEPADARSHRNVDGAAATQAEPPLHATRACLSRLEVAESALLRCQSRDRATSGTPSSLECLSDPEVAAAVEQRIEDAVREHVEGQRDLFAHASERERSAFDEWAKEALQLTADESQWLEDHVCATRELRERTIASLDETPAGEALEQLKAQREQILKDVEELLGPDRYAKLRAIGGIGLIADTTECN